MPVARRGGHASRAGWAMSRVQIPSFGGTVGAAVETFTRALRAAGLGFVRDPMDVPQIPNWNRVASALPGFLDELRDAVEADASDS